MYWNLLIWPGIFAAGVAVGIWLYRTFGVAWEKMKRMERGVHRLGKYTLGEKIGEGGMGAVYHAQHALLRRPTVVKILDADRSSPQAVARFEREVQFTSRLHHPNTVAIFDYGRTREGVFYYAMEYLEGVTLYDIVEDEGRLPPGRVIHILRQACGSLYEAHRMGLVHRDIKATNIMLCYLACIPDMVKVLDFGLVKMIDAGTTVTMEGSLTGTPLYMSPEAIRSSDKLDGRSDLYSLGVLGYYLLTGTYPFEGKTGVEICQKQMTSQPEPPSSRTGASSCPELEALILQCLAKDRDERPTDARQLAGQLAACPSADSWTEDDGLKWWESRK